MVVVLNAAVPAVCEAVAGAADVGAVRSDVPLGFAGGVNLGVRHARGDVLHVLHDDTEVEPGWLDALLEALDREPRAGLVGSLVLDRLGTVQTAGYVLWRDGSTEPPWGDGAPPDP